MVVGATGKVYLNIEVTGATGHAATPEKGINAISCMSAFLAEVDRRYGRLYEQGKAASHSALGIESRSEGYSLKIPDWCRCMMNKQLDTAETPEGFIADLKRIYEETVGRGEISVKREIPFYPSYVMDTDNADFRALIHTIETVGGFSPGTEDKPERKRRKHFISSAGNSRSSVRPSGSEFSQGRRICSQGDYRKIHANS